MRQCRRITLWFPIIRKSSDTGTELSKLAGRMYLRMAGDDPFDQRGAGARLADDKNR